MGVITLLGIAVTTLAGLAWNFWRDSRNATNSWTDFYTYERQEAFALRHNPTWLAEIRRRRVEAAKGPLPTQDNMPVNTDHRDAA